MLNGLFKYPFTDAEQRNVAFRSHAHRWSVRIWTPVYVVVILGLLVTAFLNHDKALLIPTGILIVSGLRFLR